MKLNKKSLLKGKSPPKMILQIHLKLLINYNYENN